MNMNAISRRSGKTVAAGVAVTAAVGVALLATIFMRGGGTGSGAGRGTGPASGTGPATTAPAGSPAAAAAAPQSLASYTPERPMQITVRESSYLVGGQDADLKQVTELAAKVPAGTGPAITIERDPTSRAKAENDLKEALNQQKIPYTSD